MTILSLLLRGGVGRAPLESGELRPPLGRDRRPDDSCPSQTFGLFLCSPLFCRRQLFHNTTAILAVQSPTGLLLVLLTHTFFLFHIFHMSCPPRTVRSPADAITLSITVV
eukprot:scaffold19359_cov26-Attheya_sp.AAC.2